MLQECKNCHLGLVHGTETCKICGGRGAVEVKAKDVMLSSKVDKTGELVAVVTVQEPSLNLISEDHVCNCQNDGIECKFQEREARFEQAKREFDKKPWYKFW